MRLCIFCSANEKIDRDFFTMAEELGRWAASRAHTIVFGGHDAGLMHAVSMAARQAGGSVVGVVPKKIEQMGKLSPWMDVHIPCNDLTDRKQIMMEQSDAFIVLPGGIGTLDELFTVMAAATLDYHHKPVVLFNMKGFWTPLANMLDSLQRQGVMRTPWNRQLHLVNSLDELASLL